MSESSDRNAGKAAPSQSVDFRRPAPLLTEQAKAIRSINEEFAERLSPMLSSRLRTPCRLVVKELEMVSGAELLLEEGAPVPATAIIDSPVGSQSVWQFPPMLATVVVDLLLGGTGEGEDSERVLTEIEIQVLGRLVELCLPSLSIAWERLLTLRPRLIGVQADPEARLPIAPGDPALRVTFDVQLGDHELDTAIWVPNGILTAALRRLEPTAPVPAPKHKLGDPGALGVSVLRAVPVDVSVTFPPVPMTPAAVLELGVGDVIPLHSTADPLELSAGDIRIGWVRPAQHGGKTACQVMSLEPPPRAKRRA